MAVGDGMIDKVGNDPVQAGSLLALLPSVAVHGLVGLIIWLGILAEEQVQPPVTFISLAPAATLTPSPAPPAPVVPAPEPELEAELMPLPETGMVLPQPEAPREPVLDFTPPEAPALESFPFDPNVTRPVPESEDAVPLEKAEEKPKPKQEKPRAAKVKPAAKPKPKQDAQQVAARQSKPAQALAPAAPSVTTSKTAPAAPANPAPAAVSDAPVRVTNPALAGNCPTNYPERARRRNQEGTVVLRFMISTDGKPFDITVIQSSGHELLDEAAQEILGGCKFMPQMRGNRAVTAIADQPMPFRLK
jgi:protein TonB